MGYPWDYTINNSYQDNCAGCGVSGLASNGFTVGTSVGYPVIIDLFHVQSTYPDFTTAADGGYDSYYQQTAQSLAPYAKLIYAVRIDSEFNGSWSTWCPYNSSTAVDPATWIAGYTNLVTAVRQALPNAKIIWNANIGQNSPFPYYPGDNLVDIIGIDAYSAAQYYATSADCWNDYLSGLGGINLTAFATFGQQHGKPLSFPEWGDTFGDGYYIQQMRTWMDDNNVVAASYWDTGDDISPGTCSLVSQPTDQQAYVAAFGNRPYTGTYWSPIIPVP
jgi:beta-mannanase